MSFFCIKTFNIKKKRTCSLTLWEPWLFAFIELDTQIDTMSMAFLLALRNINNELLYTHLLPAYFTLSNKKQEQHIYVTKQMLST